MVLHYILPLNIESSFGGDKKPFPIGIDYGSLANHFGRQLGTSRSVMAMVILNVD